MPLVSVTHSLFIEQENVGNENFWSRRGMHIVERRLSVLGVTYDILWDSCEGRNPKFQAARVAIIFWFMESKNNTFQYSG